MHRNAHTARSKNHRVHRDADMRKRPGRWCPTRRGFASRADRCAPEGPTAGRRAPQEMSDERARRPRPRAPESGRGCRGGGLHGDGEHGSRSLSGGSRARGRRGGAGGRQQRGICVLGDAVLRRVLVGAVERLQFRRGQLREDVEPRRRPVQIIEAEELVTRGDGLDETSAGPDLLGAGLLELESGISESWVSKGWSVVYYSNRCSLLLNAFKCMFAHYNAFSCICSAFCVCCILGFVAFSCILDPLCLHSLLLQMRDALWCLFSMEAGERELSVCSLA